MGLLEDFSVGLADDAMILGNILGSEAAFADHVPLFGFLVCRIGALQAATLEYSGLLRDHLSGGKS